MKISDTFVFGRYDIPRVYGNIFEYMENTDFPGKKSHKNKEVAVNVTFFVV